MRKTRHHKSILWIVACVIILIGILNLVAPHSYSLFGINHSSYLSRSFQIIWVCISLLILFTIGRINDRSRLIKWIPTLVCICFIISLGVFRTEFPATHGDGESGGSPPGETATLSAYPALDGRLQSFLSQGLALFVPDNFRLSYSFCGIFEDFVKNSRWILLTLLSGALSAMVITIFLYRARITPIQLSGIQLFVLTSAPMLNAYGHFDSYIIPVMMIAFWFLSLWRIKQFPKSRQNYIWLLLMVLGCAWSHPILMILAGPSLLYVMLTALKHYRCMHIRGVWFIVSGTIFGLSPYVLKAGNMDYFNKELTPLIPWLLHEKCMSCLQVALPALMLGVISIILSHSGSKRLSPLRNTGLFIFSFSIVCFFSLWVGYGVRDEFLYALFGSLLTGSALLLLPCQRHDVLLSTAVLSLYLFIPRMIVYSGPELIDRFSHAMKHDRTSASRAFTPYYLISGFLPLDNEYYRLMRLQLLREGFSNPLPEWNSDHYRTTCLAHYTAWCFEFGQDKEGRKGIHILLQCQPSALPHLWKGNGRAFRTDRYLNRSPRKCRDSSRDILHQALEMDPDNSTVQELLKTLAYVETSDPVLRYGPRPGTLPGDIDSDILTTWESIDSNQ